MKNVAIFSLLSALLFCCSTKAKAQVNPSDSLELVNFYQTVCNAGCVLNWDFAQPVHTWEGISLNNNSVREIFLSDVGLNGAIPDLNLPNLTDLYLGYNRLGETIPNFSGLPRLRYLFLDGNRLKGSIPNFSNLPNLLILELSDNRLGNVIPNFSNLPNLESLSLLSNRLSGTIPDFTNLPKLVDVWLGGNELSGTIPDFSNLPRLTILDLGHNQLSGTIPDFTGLINLNELYVNSNQLSGTIPNFNNLSKLSYLYLGNNQLSGTVPNFNNLPRLIDLYLNHNQLNGVIPNFSNLPNLEWLDLGNNQFTGCFPEYLMSLCNIYDVNFGNNPGLPDNGNFDAFCSGTLEGCDAPTHPSDSLELVSFYQTTCNAGCTLIWDFTQPVNTWEGITVTNGSVSRIAVNNHGLTSNIPNLNLPNLTGLVLAGNQLGGSVPNFSNTPDLTHIDLNNNQLSGSVDAFINLSNLTYLDLSNNQFNGTIPDFSALQDLTFLNLDDNQLSGDFPEYLIPLCDISATFNNNSGLPDNGDFQLFCTLNNSNYVSASDSLELVNFYQTLCNVDCTLEWDFTQPVYTWQGIVVADNAVTEIAIHGRDLSGTIPDLNLPKLTSLNLRNNYLDGQITDFSHLQNLTVLILGNNYFSGSIPNFNLPNLEALILYENQLSGPIPDFNLPNLESLNLGYNSLNNSVPNFFNLPNLKYLTLYSNKLSGSIPDFNLPNLEMLDLHSNQLSGTVPDFTNLPKLLDISLGYNELNGSIPNYNMPDLIRLELNNNQLSGPIPDFSSLPNLEALYLFGNQLSGSIPDFSNLSKLNRLNLHYNQLSGSIPDFTNNLPNLTHLLLKHNLLSGTVPDFSTLNLDYVNISYNNFSHEDISENHAVNSPEDFTYIYTPQYYGNEQFHTNPIGATVVLSPDPAIPSNNPSVSWLKNNNLLTPVYSPLTPTYILHDTTYVIPALDTTDIGVYQYRFVDYTLSPRVYFYSRPINNYVEGLDLEGEPIIQGELILEYGTNKSQAEIDSIRNELIMEYGGVILDSCGCKVQLDLWKFGDDDVDAVREVIGINGTHERRTSSTEIDGNRDNLIVPDYNEAEYILIGNPVENPNDSAQVVVGVIDTGINVFHNAVYDNLWKNQTEQNGISGVDDDNNGYADDIFGYDFVSDSLMHDMHGHGTKVGGIITANTPQNMDIKVMPVRTFNNEGRGSLFDMLCGVYYAIENGSDIVNISAGYKGQKSIILQKALQYGRDRDVLFVVAAGNDTLDLDAVNYWPATFTRDNTLENTVITVTALDSTYNLTDYASYGDSTISIATSGQGLLAPAGYDTESFDYISGTSASAPIVSLALATEKIKYPNKNSAILREDFLNDADVVADLIDIVEEGRMLNVEFRQLSKLRVFLEGALLNFDGTYRNDMKTTLNERGLLPGQRPISSLALPTPSGQPYKNTPWNYNGLEWSNTDHYLEDRVDWVLVSLRTEVTSDTEIYRSAAQVKKDGTVEFYRPIEDLTGVVDSVYILIEHRNHMAVMSPQKVPVYNGRFVYDFTKQDSYKDVTSVGQIEVKPGVWAMIVGDSSQENDEPYYDINGDDKAIWVDENGLYDQYLQSDYDMNGDVNGIDKKTWSYKIGLSNRVPK